MKIKFKAKRIEDGKWVYGYYVEGHQSGMTTHYIYDDLYPNKWYWTEIDINTLCQFTGIQDSNGKDVYECDMISNPDAEGHDAVFEVRYDEDFLQLLFCNKDDGDFSLMEMCEYLDYWDASKIIGNKYDETTTSKEDNKR